MSLYFLTLWPASGGSYEAAGGLASPESHEGDGLRCSGQVLEAEHAAQDAGAWPSGAADHGMWVHGRDHLWGRGDAGKAEKNKTCVCVARALCFLCARVAVMPQMPSLDSEWLTTVRRAMASGTVLRWQLAQQRSPVRSRSRQTRWKRRDRQQWRRRYASFSWTATGWGTSRGTSATARTTSTRTCSFCASTSRLSGPSLPLPSRALLLPCARSSPRSTPFCAAAQRVW